MSTNWNEIFAVNALLILTASGTATATVDDADACFTERHPLNVRRGNPG